MERALKISYFFLVVLFIGCTSGKVVSKNISNNDKLIDIPPNNCRVAAKIVKIFDVEEKKKDDKSLCSRFPCYALIKVEKIIGTGRSFSTPLTVNQEIKVFFKHTLRSQKETKQNLNYELPGLDVGDTFEADIEGLDSFGGEWKYIIYNYRKL